MKTLRVGIASYEDYKARTMAIARGEHKPSREEPKVWFTSIESLAKVLSDRNRELLQLIAESNPGSLEELAEKSQRAPSNLSRTLKTMEKYGLLRLERGEGKKLVPRVAYDNIELGLPLRTPVTATAGGTRPLRLRAAGTARKRKMGATV